jgi:hypothetical protein
MRRRCICRDKVDVELLLFGGMGGFGRRLKAAKFIRGGELVETLETEELEEKRGGFVKERAAGQFGASGDADDFTLEQGGDHAINRDPAHGLDLRPADGLAIGDDGESFQGGLAEAGRLGSVEELVGPDGELGAGLELETAGDALDHEAGAIGFELGAEEVEGGLDFDGAASGVGRGFGGGRELGRLGESLGDGFGCERTIRGEEQGFDDARQVHQVIFGNLGEKARGKVRLGK